ncbi:MAG TPA: S49 family peptidase, partial [Paracoccaceae bacterium]|nr:S49 family peptidase [Paracoccaceae bacterium]
LMETVGVQMQTVRSSDVKGGSSPFRSATAAETEENEVLVNDAYQWFRGLVAERRNLDGADLDAVTTGGAFSGRQALQLGLIDAIGGEVEALGYLESLHPDFATLPVETWILETNAPIWTEFLASKVGITSLLSEIYPRQGQRLYSLAR